MLSAEYIKQNVGLDEVQAGIKFAGRNIKKVGKNGQEGEIASKGFAVKPATSASNWNSVPPRDSGIQCIKHQGTVEKKAKETGY